MNKNKKGSAAIIAVVVLVVLVAIGAVWYFMSEQGSDSSSVVTNTSGSGSVATSTATTTGAATVGTTGTAMPPSSAWNSYRNATSGFAFQYPANLNGKIVTRSLPFNETSITVNGSRPSNTTNTTALPQLQITVNAKQASDTVQSDIIKIKNDPSQCMGTLAVSTTTIVGQQAALFICTPRATLNLAPYAILDFYHNAQGFRIVVTNEPSSQDVAKEIGNTFTFTK